jgi:aspartate-semialdehyde dehydrogenase
MKKIALVGATGNVGRKVLEIIENKQIKVDITPISSSKSAGSIISIFKQSKTVLGIQDIVWANYDIALFTTSAEIADEYIPKVLVEGLYVIDSSSRYRMDHSVPLVVPPINLTDAFRSGSKLFSTANCIASPISIVLSRLMKKSPIKRVVLSTYQSVSGAGKEALEELKMATQKALENESFSPAVFSKNIAFNVIPQIDTVVPNGNTGEETKIILELKKLLGQDLKVAVQSVRVPVFFGHSVSVFVEFESPISPSDAKSVLKESSAIKVIEDTQTCKTPTEIEGEDLVYVSRIRQDTSVDHGLIFWTTSDNVRRGAALDVVEVLEGVLSI